jgi:hypothetical protein
MDQCYMCNADAVSREHVPPRCIFPTNTDIPEKSYRENLITVPSCDLHNSAKSMEDEFLMVSLAGIIGNNSIGYRHKFGKVERALRRRSHKLLDKVITKKQAAFQIGLDDNKFIEVLWGTPDIERLNSCFQNIAYGLHLHHFGRRFVGSTRIHLGYLHYNKGNPDTWNRFLRERAELDLNDKPYQGANPDVFQYKVSDVDNFGLYLMKLYFYGGIEVYIAFIPEGVQVPQNPVELSLKAGIPAIISVKDKAFYFHPNTD